MLSKEFKKGRAWLIKKDPTLKALFKRHKDLEFSAALKRTPYESLVRAIAHQQLHGKAAETIMGRLIKLFPHKKFPTPEDILSLTDVQMRACGYSGNKVKSIKDIAQKTVDGIVPTKEIIRKMSNEDIIQKLTTIYGVGKWTVEMLLIFQLGRLDVWPADDFGVRNGFKVWKKKKIIPTAKEVRPYGLKWAPYQTIVALYLWWEADNSKN